MKNFEFESQICTSKEQSEKLLALGLKKETADFGHCSYGGTYIVPKYPNIHNWDNDIPAWSLHRLMEILMKGDKLGCITHNIHQNNVSTYYELVIASIEHLIKIDEFTKDYLEEKK